MYAYLCLFHGLSIVSGELCAVIRGVPWRGSITQEYGASFSVMPVDTHSLDGVADEIDSCDKKNSVRTEVG